MLLRQAYRVTPFVGVWIETKCAPPIPDKIKVTPFVGVWIETFGMKNGGEYKGVTPFVGVWIETKQQNPKAMEKKSHPSWVCGLKPYRHKST